MNFSDLKDRLKEVFNELLSRIEESQTFQTLKERFESLSPRSQKVITWGSIGFVTLMIASCPYGYWSTSSDQVSQFNDIRSTIRNLLRASQVSAQLAGVTPDMNVSAAQSRVQNEVSQFGLQPDQIGTISTAPATEVGPLLAPTSIEQHALSVELKRLNLRQIVDLGHRLQSIQGTLKLAGLDILATSDNDHYFDVTYRLINFSLGSTKTASTPSGGRPNFGGRSASPNTSDAADDFEEEIDEEVVE